MTAVVNSLESFCEYMDYQLPGVPSEHHGIYVDLLFEQCRISVELRPPYCNRGRFIVKVDQEDPTVLTVDHADGFPRYYFHADAAAKEIAAWAHARNLTPRAPAKMRWTQPSCAPCWNEHHPDRPAGRSGDALPETCVYCGEPTRSGIYVRIDPATAPYPTLQKAGR